MKNIWISCAALGLAALGLFSFAPARVHAQNAKARTMDGKPDFSGIYEWPKASSGERCRCSATIFDKALFPSLKPGGEPLYEPPNGDPRHDEPRNFCMPAGFPSGMLSANAVQFVENKNYLVIVHEFQRMTRVIPIDTSNFKRWGLDDYYYTNPKEYRMHSDALHTIERISWKDDKTLNYQLILDDPKTFTKSWTQTFTMAAKPEWDSVGLFEYVCEENNRCEGGKCAPAESQKAVK